MAFSSPEKGASGFNPKDLSHLRKTASTEWSKNRLVIAIRGLEAAPKVKRKELGEVEEAESLRSLRFFGLILYTSSRLRGCSSKAGRRQLHSLRLLTLLPLKKGETKTENIFNPNDRAEVY